MFDVRETYNIRPFMHRVLVLALGAFALGLDAYVMAGLLPTIAGDLHVSLPAAGQLVTAFTLCYALAAPVFATVLSGKMARPVLAAALVVFTIANALSALANSFPLLLATRAVAGLGAGLYSPLAVAAAASLVPARQRGRGLALVMGGMSTGVVLGVPAGLALASYAGWRSTLWLVTALGTLTLAGLLAWLPTIPTVAPPSIRQRLSMLMDGRVASVVGVSFLAAVASLGLYTYLVPVLGVAGSHATPYFLTWGMGGVVGSFGIGSLLDRTSRPFMLVACILGTMALAMLLLPVLAPSTTVLIPLAFWGAAGWALQVPQQHTLLTARPDHGTVAVAINGSALYLGSAVGSALGGTVLSSGMRVSLLPVLAGGIAFSALILHLGSGEQANGKPM